MSKVVSSNKFFKCPVHYETYNALFLLIFSGKVEFDADEDAHVVGDCVKVLILILITDHLI
jgi:hypothetical protein